MTTQTAPSTTYDLTVGVKLDMEDVIQLLSPMDIPLQGGEGGDGSITLPTGPAMEVKVEWMDETLLTPRSTLAASTFQSTNNGTVLTVATGDQSNFQPGDILLVGAEYARVTSYGSNDDLNVSRAFSGTAATHTVGDAVICVGQALTEGSVPGNAKFNDRTERFNVTQIFGPLKVSTSGTEQVIAKYGVTNEHAKQMANRLKEMGVAVEQAIIYGARVNDTNNKLRQMGGMLYYIQTNVDSTTTDLTETKLLDIMQKAWAAGGNLEFGLCSALSKRKISGFSGFQSGVQFQVQRTDNTRGAVVDVYESDFGTISLKLHRWLRSQDLIMAARDQFRVETLRPITYEPLGKVGDSDEAMLVGEKTFKVYRERHAARFSGIVT